MDPNQTKTKEAELDKKLADIQSKRAEAESETLAQKLGLPFSDLKSAPIDDDAILLLDEATARKSGLAIISKDGNKITAAVLNPENKDTKEVLEILKNKGFTVNIIVTSFDSLQRILSKYSLTQNFETFEVGAIDIKENSIKEFENQIKDVSELKNRITSISATEMLEVLIAGALKFLASDIHFEPEQNESRIRYRLDGVLNDITSIDKEAYTKLLNRIKVLSKMKLNIHNSPQDGRFTIREKDVDIEVRVSVLPSEFGETIVMRLLDPRTINAELEQLGVRSDLLQTIKEQLNKSTGAILTTGPTGSGKTTTLYSFLRHLNSTGTKIITIEDPIEYHIEGISQTQVDSKKGYSFSNGLRAIVRQDPDIILVGEIRDAETADIALQASLTGHLVLSTIHTNNAAGTIPRLIDLGIKPQIIAPAINMAMAQRLIRRLCPKCKIKGKLETAVLEKIKTELSPLKERFKLPEINDSLEVYFPNKCENCNGTGYKGRLPVFEIFLITKEMEKLILKSPAISEVEELAISQGMVTMLQDAYLKLLEGESSVEEINRVVG